MLITVMKYRPKSNKGFTLLEVLLAISIFAMISLASFTIFNTVLDSDKATKLKNDRINELNRAFMLIERDLLQMTRRTIRINGESPLSGYLHTNHEGLSSDTQMIGFVRAGWTNPGLLLPRSDLQSVAYQLTENTFERLHFNFVDAVVGQEPKVRPLITLVDNVTFEFFEKGKWQKDYDAKDLPQAIAIIVETSDFGTVRREFLVAGGAK